MRALAVVIAAAGWVGAHASGGAGAPRETAIERAGFEDYRTPIGRMVDGELQVKLEARRALWSPWGPGELTVPANVFAEPAKQARVPGPFMRVRVGTPVRVSLRNMLGDTLVVRGLRDRGGQRAAPGTPTAGDLIPAFGGDSTVIAPGATRDIRFTPTTPGTYAFYGNSFAPGWSATTQPLRRWGGPDDLLNGIFIVDSVGEVPHPDERMLVVSQWADSTVPESHRASVRFMVNGRSWPGTERLAYSVGDTARIRLVNVGSIFHPMHLHGFYFRIDQRHTATGGRVFRPGQRPERVTAALSVGNLLRISFVPHTAGNWLLHCHLMRHMSTTQAAPQPTPGQHAHTADRIPSRGDDPMAGLVVGITVRERRDVARTAPVARRRLRLHINRREGAFGNEPGYAFVLQEGDRAPALDSVRFPGSPIVLRRGEPAEIKVFNHADIPLAVHWHGLELESRSDGVPGWSGGPVRAVRATRPGDSLLVRITPPRAGTFMYHVHSEPGHQLALGLYGAFKVVEPDAPFDSETDRSFVLAALGPGDDPPPAVNGARHPPDVELRAGVTYRFRFMQIAPDDVKRIGLFDGDTLVRWRLVAQDGADIPPAFAPLTPSAIANSDPGGTMDVEFIPTRPGTLTLRVVTVFDAGAPGFARKAPPADTTNIRVVVRP